MQVKFVNVRCNSCYYVNLIIAAQLNSTTKVVWELFIIDGINYFIIKLH